MLFIKSLIAVILLIQTGLAAEPTLEDNKLPLDDEYDLWHRGGQPEVPVRGGEQSFNAFYSGGRNDHFVSAIFPEVDARGFHASAFDNFENVYPAPRRYGLTRTKPFLKDQYAAVKDELWAQPKFKDKLIDELWKRTSHPRNDKKMAEKSLHKNSQVHENIRKPEKVSFVRNNSNGLLDEKFKYEENCCEELDSFNEKNEDMRIMGSLASDKKEDKRSPDMNSRGFHGDTFSRGFGHFGTMDKRAPDMTAMGFHGDTFNRGYVLPGLGTDSYGEFDSIYKKSPDMNSRGFHGDTFSRGFGNFDTMDKRSFERNIGKYLREPPREDHFDSWDKKAPDMNSRGFHSDAFSRGFGHFDTMDKRVPDMSARGFHGDTFSRGFGNFDTMDKRAPDMTAMGFHGDTFNRGFGHFDTMDKRAPDMSARGFHGDTFSRGFGNFDTMDKRSSVLGISYGWPILREGKHGSSDNALSDMTMRWPKKIKRAPRSQSKRFFLVKRVPDMTSNDWHGDTFHTDFGGFNTMK